MRAMVLERPGTPLVLRERPTPVPAAGEVLVEIAACGVCRTDLHVVDGELPDPKLPVVPGHEIVGRVAAIGAGVTRLRDRRARRHPLARRDLRPLRVLPRASARTCATRRCSPATRATAATPRTRSPTRAIAFRCPRQGDAAALAPLLCAGLIGWRSYRMAGEGSGARPLRLRRRRPHPRPGRGRGRAGASTPSPAPATRAAQDFARSLGAVWAGGSSETPPEPLDAAIIFAPVGALVPRRCRR